MNKKKLLALLMALVMTLTLVPVTAFADEKPVAKIGENEYATLAAAINAVKEARNASSTTVTLLNNTDEKELTIDFTYPIVIDGQGQYGFAQGTYSTEQDTHAIKITVPNADVTFDGVTVGSNKIKRGINVDNSAGLKLTVRNGSKIYAGHYPLNILPGSDNAVINVTDSEVIGYCALNHWGNYCTINFTNSVLQGLNDAGLSESNDFATICIEAEVADFSGTSMKDKIVTGNVITVDGCTVGASSTNGNNQSIVVINGHYGAIAKEHAYNPHDNTVVFRNNVTSYPTSFVENHTADSYNNNVVVYGGTYSSDVSAYCAPGYKAVENNGTWTVSAKDYVAQIVRTGEKFETLDAAIAAANDDGDGDTVKLLQDITYGTDKEVSIWEKAVNLDLNGHILTTHSTKSVTLSNDGYKASAVCYSIPLNSTGSVTISNGTIETDYGAGVYADNPGLTLTLENLTIIAGREGPQNTPEYTSAVRITGGAKVIINSGTYTSPANALTVSNSGGEFVVNDGTFSGKVFISYNNPATTKSITINGGKFSGTFEKKAGTITINGGVFTNDAKTSAASVATLGEGKIWTNNSDSETSASYPYTVGVPVAEFGGTQYTKLADAIAAANVNGGIVTLLRDYDMEANEPGYGWTTLSHSARENFLVISGNVTFDLDGHTLSNLFNNTFKITGNVTVQNGEMQVGRYTDGASCSYVMITDEGANLTVNNLTTYGGINVAGGSTATINDLAFSGTLFYAVCSQENSTVTINGGTFNKAIDGSTKKLFWIENGSIMNITGGNFNIEGKSANFLNGNVKPVITGGKFDFDPTNYGVAKGYEAVSISASPYTHQVGIVKATATTEGTIATSASIEFTVGTAVKESNDANAGTLAQRNDLTVTVSGTTEETTAANAPSVAVAALSNIKNDATLQAIVENAVEKASSNITGNSDNVNVVIQVAKSAPNTSTQGKVSFEVHPEAVISVNNVKVGTVELTNDQIKGTFNFKLNVSSIANPGDYVRIDHMENNAVLDSKTYRVGDDKCVVISDITRFSIFVGEKVNTETDDFKYLGASLRRRVEINQDNIVVNSCTDMRFGFVVKNDNPYSSNDKYYFQWTKDNVNWSTPVEIDRFANTTDGWVASLVITNIPADFFNTAIAARIYKNDGQNALEGDAMSVMQVATATITKYETDTSQKQWVDYAKYLTTKRGSYTVTYDTNHRVVSYNYNTEQ